MYNPNPKNGPAPIATHDFLMRNSLVIRERLTVVHQVQSGIEQVVYGVLEYLSFLPGHAVAVLIGLEHFVCMPDRLVYVGEGDFLGHQDAHASMIGLLTLGLLELLLELVFV